MTGCDLALMLSCHTFFQRKPIDRNGTSFESDPASSPGRGNRVPNCGRVRGCVAVPRLRRAIDPPPRRSDTLDDSLRGGDAAEILEGPEIGAGRGASCRGTELVPSSRFAESTFARVALGSAGPASVGPGTTGGRDQRHSTSLPRRRTDRVTGLLPWLIWVLAGVLAVASVGRTPVPSGRPGTHLSRLRSLGENRTGQEPGRPGRARPPCPAETIEGRGFGPRVGWLDRRQLGRRSPHGLTNGRALVPRSRSSRSASARGRCVVGTACSCPPRPPLTVSGSASSGN